MGMKENTKDTNKKMFNREEVREACRKHNNYIKIVYPQLSNNVNLIKCL